MGTSGYPCIHRIEKEIYFNGARRIISKNYQHDPIGMGRGKSRFSSPNGEYKILYAAAKLKTAIRETLIRDKFDNKKTRQMPRFKILEYACTTLRTTQNLNVLDLTGGSTTNVGIPSVVRHSKYYTRSRRFALEVYNEMPLVNGFCYLSRLDDNMCFAIFDRAVYHKIEVNQTDSLISVLGFRDSIKELRISIINR